MEIHVIIVLSFFSVCLVGPYGLHDLTVFFRNKKKQKLKAKKSKTSAGKGMISFYKYIGF